MRGWCRGVGSVGPASEEEARDEGGGERRPDGAGAGRMKPPGALSVGGPVEARGVRRAIVLVVGCFENVLGLSSVCR